ncbi:MAG: nucleotidyltransferase family protein [Acidimicrobiia bacterium]|nr:nucleotidyltransferase family protein [Acidimicrobiia bacterium]
MSIVGVIVAAGKSTRMGRPKQLLPIGGRPMLQWVVDAAEASTLDQVVVVTGYAVDEVRAGITLRRAIWAHNPEPDRGTMSSFRVGVDSAGQAAAVMKLVCDQPEVTSETIDQMISAWDPDTDRVSLVEYRDGAGHPMLLAATALAEVLQENGDRLLWDLAERHPEAVRRLRVDAPRPIDINAAEDLRLIAARLGY